MVRLTRDLIYNSRSHLNVLGQSELDLRGQQIEFIENLSATGDQFESIDLSDNLIFKLEDFPTLERLDTLLVNNNKIARISPLIGEFLPNLRDLILKNNDLANLVDIDPLASLSKLKMLSLVGNNITMDPEYRMHVIHKLRSLCCLDYVEVSDDNRKEADKYFADKKAKKKPDRCQGRQNDDVVGTKSANGKDDKMITDEKETNQERDERAKKDDSTKDMEQEDEDWFL